MAYSFDVRPEHPIFNNVRRFQLMDGNTWVYDGPLPVYSDKIKTKEGVYYDKVEVRRETLTVIFQKR